MMQIETLAIDDVREYERNPRVIGEDAVAAVARSIEEFGFRVPVILDADGVLIAGHTRVRAARRIGMASVPAVRASDLTPEQARAFRIADNQVASLSTWDRELLSLELGDLRAADVDLGSLGFDPDSLQRLLGSELRQGLTDPDSVPEPPDEPVTRPGDLWVLGEHRLLCGDSSRADDLDRLLDGAPVHLVNTDPPYNVRVEPRSNNAIAAGLSSFAPTHHQSLDLARHPGKSQATHRKLRPKDRPLINDFVGEAEFGALLDAWFANLSRVLSPGRCFYVWGGYANLANYPGALRANGLYFSQAIVWDKRHPVLTRKDYMGSFELAFYGWREGAGHTFLGPANATDLWQVKKVNPQSMVHLTEKPVELATRAMQHASREGEHVLDLFGGSGSTLIAAEQAGRRAFLMELDAPYCDVIVRRWEEFTGRKAERESRPDGAAASDA